MHIFLPIDLKSIMTNFRWGKNINQEGGEGGGAKI